MHVDGDLGGGDLSDLAVSALELLQWKEVEGAAALVAPLHTLLSALLPRLGSIAAPHGGDAADEDASGDEQEGRAGGAAAAAGSAAAGYASQLALLALRRLAPGGDAAAAVVARGALPEGFDVTLVLAVLAAAPDAALRNAALGLLESLARGAPEAMLGHVLEAMRLIQHSAATTDDSHSQAAAASALAAVVPAWVAAGRDAAELWASLVGALGAVRPHRRLALLATLLRALPQESGLPAALLVMLQRAAADAAAPKPAPKAAPKAATPKRGAKADKGQGREEGAEQLPEGPPEHEWLPELAAALCEQVPAAERLAALSSVLEASAAGQEPQRPLPRLAVIFATSQLKSKPLAAAARAESAAAAAAGAGMGAGADAGAAAAPVLAGCLSVMQQALLHLQLLHPTGGAEDDDDELLTLDERAGEADSAAALASPLQQQQPPKLSKKQRSVNAATRGLYGLLAALRDLMDPTEFLRALLEISDHPSEERRHCGRLRCSRPARRSRVSAPRGWAMRWRR
ncbi:hypothetical protein MNEG_14966 [Monoraphidium neglectum]|uniref:Uncharacterized protein n=1 Tax=Monoraphidium neglectum TaxID=145388 RepID=A0A0D2IYM0_9CHLO|nr:hypothetical protein MNEG_14966 [Monoraphidium neglectum]KIY92997.1 hypothetical protein MNEG_14966 [Monoraphidium neglectum]|eukprot:XP_013892017.1 hypothetical protein MNEG_14966 [Monoraphidium neglectum]